MNQDQAEGVRGQDLSSNTKGDLYVKIGLHVPERLNSDQKKLVEELTGPEGAVGGN